MASVLRENLGTLHDKLTVKLSNSDYFPAFEKNLKQYAKNANIPGFRKGMVPVGMVRKMYGPAIFQEEIIRAAGKGLEDYLKEQNLDIFGQPMMLHEADRAQPDINNPGDVDFSFEIGLKPEISLDLLNGNTPLTRYHIVVSDKMLTDEIDRIRKQYGTTDPQSEVQDGEDVLEVNFEACDESGSVAEGVTPHEYKGTLASLPVSLQEKLKGSHLEATLVFRPADVCTEKELDQFVGKTLKATPQQADSFFKLTLKTVGRIIPKELGTELYAQVFERDQIETEEAFRQKLAEEIGREYDRITNDRLQNEIFEMLVHQTPIALPLEFLKRWLREGGEHPKSAEDVEKEFGRFEHSLRWQLISDKYIRENQLAISKEEIEADIKTKVMRYFGLENEEDAPWMDGYVDKMFKDEKMLDETYNRLLTEKLFRSLETRFAVQVADISEEEFFRLNDAHATHHHH